MGPSCRPCVIKHRRDGEERSGPSGGEITNVISASWLGAGSEQGLFICEEWNHTEERGGSTVITHRRLALFLSLHLSRYLPLSLILSLTFFFISLPHSPSPSLSLRDRFSVWKWNGWIQACTVQYCTSHSVSTTHPPHMQKNYDLAYILTPRTHSCVTAFSHTT